MKIKVAIIGAGASGLVGIKSCLDENITPVCFEKSNHVGGLWYYTTDAREGEACVMKTTVINTSKEMMCFSDFPIPAEYPNYMHNTKVYEYFKLYTEAFDLYDHIKFNHSVDKISKVDSSPGKWRIDVTDLTSGKSSQEVFDAVLLCNGHHAETREPKFPGQSQFKVSF